MTSFDDWTAARLAAVTSPTGNLALVGYQSVTSPDPVPIEGLPATVALLDGYDGVLIDAEASAGITVGAEPVTGPTRVARLRPDGTPLVHRGDVTVDVFSLDGTDIELRRYDAGAPALTAFAGIDVYPEDPTWRITGRFEPYPETEKVPWAFTRAIDDGHAKSVPGAIHLDVGGTAHELRAFLDGQQLVLVFADGTTGAETYAPGRFLRIPAPSPEGAVEVDFNRSFIPPCGFSDHYSCPLPPPGNRLAVPVRAGEKTVLWSGSRPV